MKETYITPAFIAVELSMSRATMLTGSTDGGSSSQILTDGGEGNGQDIGAKEITSKSLWDEEW